MIDLPEMRFTDNGQISQRMSKIRSVNTKPELALRRALWLKGFRYLVNDKRLPGKPDVVLPKYRTAVFVHGCFWHGHEGCSKYTIPKTNTDFWKAKVARNKERDQETWRQLEAMGWFVIVVWECELKKYRFEDTVNSVAAQLHQNKNTFEHLRSARKKARALYQEERRQRKKHEQALTKELHQKYPR